MTSKTRRDIVEQYINDTARNSFFYGVFDCCLFGCGMIERLTGKNWREDFPSYDGSNVLDVLEELGGVDAIASHCLGDSLPLDDTVADGDLVACDIGPLGRTLGVATPSNGQAVFQTPRYVMQIPLTKCDVFWRVG